MKPQVHASTASDLSTPTRVSNSPRSRRPATTARRSIDKTPAEPQDLSNHHTLSYTSSPTSKTNKKNRQSLQYLAPQESRSLSSPRTENGVVVILPSGNLLLEVQSQDGSEIFPFRVFASRLRDASQYFRQLLESLDFSEGIDFQRKHEELAERYKNVVDIPSEELPCIRIVDIGMVSPSVKSIGPLITDFLLLLHNLEPTRKISSSSLANLAIVADRFDATGILGAWARAKGMLRPPPGTSAPLGEEAHRQRILVGLLLDQPQWVSAHSAQLIIHGSVRWTSSDANETFTALWWELPRGFEDELQYRRLQILATIADLQQHILDLYVSRNRQCRLGYDTSPQCDSFQLGEFIKFLAKTGTLHLGSPLTEAEPFDDSARDIRALIATLRSCPSYQLDSNHSHCGPRKQFISGLNIIEQCLAENSLGLCLECWYTQSPEERSWETAKRLVCVNTAKILAESVTPITYEGRNSKIHYHHRGRELFLANERLWLQSAA